eukprot:m.14059 g.14059  ORF g.14059 m.14059 type:complete len:363 (-) comp8744_c0_seq1:83-1171(-)
MPPSLPQIEIIEGVIPPQLYNHVEKVREVFVENGKFKHIRAKHNKLNKTGKVVGVLQVECGQGTKVIVAVSGTGGNNFNNTSLETIQRQLSDMDMTLAPFSQHSELHNMEPGVPLDEVLDTEKKRQEFAEEWVKRMRNRLKDFPDDTNQLQRAVESSNIWRPSLPRRDLIELCKAFHNWKTNGIPEQMQSFMAKSMSAPDLAEDELLANGFPRENLAQLARFVARQRQKVKKIIVKKRYGKEKRNRLNKKRRKLRARISRKGLDKLLVRQQYDLETRLRILTFLGLVGDVRRARLVAFASECAEDNACSELRAQLLAKTITNVTRIVWVSTKVFSEPPQIKFYQLCPFCQASFQQKLRALFC